MKPNTDTDATDNQTNISPDCIDNDSFEDKSVRREMSHTKIPQDSNDSFAVIKAKDDTNENDFDEISQKPKIVPQANDTNSSTKNETACLESKILHISQESNDLTTSSDKKNDDTQDISSNTSEFSHNDNDDEQPKDTSSSNVNPPQSDEYQSKSRSRQRFKSGPVEIRQVEIDVEDSEREDDNETAALIESNNGNTDSIDDYEIEAPYDVYSILLITPSYWRCHFFFVFFVFSSQVTLQALIFFKLISDIFIWDDSKKGVDTFGVPVDVSTSVRIAQVFALFIAVLTADDALSSLSMIGMVPVGHEYIPCYMRLSSFWLRMFVGVVGIVISLFIITVSDDIFKMFADFAAMAFVNTIDNVLFHMCQANFITASLRKTAREVKKLKFGRESVRSIYCRRIGVLLLSAGIFSAFAFVWSNQSKGLNRNDSIHIYGMCAMGECDKEHEEMMFRNGEYSFETMNEGKPVYQERNAYETDVDVRGVIYFCRIRWYIGVRNMSIPLEIGQGCDVNGKPWIYRSPRVDYADKFTTKVTDFNYWYNSAYGSHLKISAYEAGYRYDSDCEDIHTSEDADFVGFLGDFADMWSIRLHGKYVYFNDDKFIIFLGSRWIMTTSELVPKLSAYSSSADSFHPLYHEWSALYASELTTSDNPSNLKWFAKPNGTINKNDFISGDLGYPVKGTFLCGLCVNDTNTLCDYRVVGHASITIENNDHVVCEYKNVKLYNRNTTLYSGAEFHNATNQTKHEVRYAVNKTHLSIEHHIDIIGTIRTNSTLLSISRNRYAYNKVEATIVIGRGKAGIYPNLHDKSNPMCMRSIELADSRNIFDQSQKVYIKFEIDIAGHWKK